MFNNNNSTMTLFSPQVFDVSLVCSLVEPSLQVIFSRIKCSGCDIITSGEREREKPFEQVSVCHEVSGTQQAH